MKERFFKFYGALQFSKISHTYSAIKKNEVMPFAATWMQPEITILSEVSQKDKDKYHVISLICGI